MTIHCIGIGGIGMSALARYYKSEGHDVGGSDIASSEITKGLKKEGISVKVGAHKAANITHDIDFLVYSAAVKNDNIELKEAKKLGIPVKKYAEALGEITKQYFTICVTGTHGKSTTTAMLALVLIKAGFNPTVILGTKLKEFDNTNFHRGSKKPRGNFKKPLLVIEADEWQASFLNYHPGAVIITNIEKEHLDYYHNFSHIIKTFKEFIELIRPGGILILNQDDKGIIRLKSKISDINLKTSFYSKNQPEAKELKKILKVPGEHNLSNALAALTLSRALGIADKIVFRALALYQEAWRRFEMKHVCFDRQDLRGTKRRKTLKNITLINDYAHHPTEIRATIKGAREKFGRKPLWIVFQPHQQQRTHYLFKDFVRAFDGADLLILADIYEVSGREKSGLKLTSRDLALAIDKHWQKHSPTKKVIYLKSFKKIANYIKKNINEHYILLIMGAGDVYKLNERL